MLHTCIYLIQACINIPELAVTIPLSTTQYQLVHIGEGKVLNKMANY